MEIMNPAAGIACASARVANKDWALLGCPMPQDADAQPQYCPKKTVRRSVHSLIKYSAMCRRAKKLFPRASASADHVRTKTSFASIESIRFTHVRDRA